MPTNIMLYNKYMGGVDRADQLRSYYQRKVKTTKYYMYIFHFLLECAISNSFILMKNYSQHVLGSFLNFRQELAEQLIQDYCNRKRYSLLTEVFSTALDASTTPTKRRRCSDVQAVQHFPVRGPSKGRCSYCWYILEERHDTITTCRQCNVHLCIDRRVLNDVRYCFELYHTT
jgi:hypothetical protein